MNGSDSLPYLSAGKLEALDITTEEVVASIEHLIRGRRESKVWNAPKAVLSLPDGRTMMAMLSAADDPPYLAAKSLVVNPANRQRGLNNVNSLITLQDSDTGLPLAVLDGNWITAVRTAGISAVAAKRLARPESSVAAFIGCGVQAESHLRQFSSLFPLAQIRAFGRGRKNIDKLCRVAEEVRCAFVDSASARDAVAGADLVVSSVSMSPDLDSFIDASWLEKGVFANLTDLGIPWISDSMSSFDRIFIDDLEQEAQMPNQMVDKNMVAGDITGIVHGDMPGRRSDSEKIAFVFRGLAIGDLALAGLAYQRAFPSL